MRDAVARLLAILSVAVAIPAQCLMFVAEWLGDLSDEWTAD